MTSVFQALSDPTRREIIRILRKGDRTAGELCEEFDLARSTMSGHFRILRSAELIVAEKNGTTIVFSLNASAIEEALTMILDLLDMGRDSADAHGKETPT